MRKTLIALTGVAMLFSGSAFAQTVVEPGNSCAELNAMDAAQANSFLSSYGTVGASEPVTGENDNDSEGGNVANEFDPQTVIAGCQANPEAMISDIISENTESESTD